MTDNKLIALLFAQTYALCWDAIERQCIAHYVVAEVGMMPEDVFSRNLNDVLHDIEDFVNYAYTEETKKPEWVKDELFEDW